MKPRKEFYDKLDELELTQLQVLEIKIIANDYAFKVGQERFRACEEIFSPSKTN